MSEQAGGAAPTASNWNLPNALTVVRIVMVPFFVVALIAGGVYGADSLGARWAALALCCRNDYGLGGWLLGTFASAHYQFREDRGPYRR